MDAVTSEVCNPHLKHVLRTFQAAANTSLCGPSGNSWFPPGSARAVSADLESYRSVLANFKPSEAFEFKVPHSVRINQMPPPILISPDRSVCEKSQTTLEGETIACFEVGGEKRLCLPQILNSVLREFTLPQINKVCDELYIYCSRCTPEQLHTFKVTGVLPAKAPSCGLITKTDAERLCSALLHEPRQGEPRDVIPKSDSGACFRVYHKCFGKAYGVLYPDAYVSEASKFIECLDCGQLMTAPRFVCHSHKVQENRVVHWGFDSELWRSYVLLGKDQDNQDKLHASLKSVKARFCDRPKRRHQIGHEKKETDEAKRSHGTDSDRGVARRPGDRSAFHKWAPEQNGDGCKNAADRQAAGASTGARAAAAAPTPPAESPAASGPPPRCSPPALADPRRVVLLSDIDRYGKHFVPNVSLAPPQQRRKSVTTESGDPPLESKVAVRYGSVSPQHSGEWRRHYQPYHDDEAAILLARLRATGIGQEVIKSTAAMSSMFAEALQYASLDERQRLRLEEGFLEHCGRLEQLFGHHHHRHHRSGSGGSGSVAAGPAAKKPRISAAVPQHHCQQ